MRQLFWIALLALACFAGEARSPGVRLFPLGSTCEPSQAREDGTLNEPRCVPLAYAPIGSSFKRSFHEDLPWANRLKSDRIAPRRVRMTKAAR